MVQKISMERIAILVSDGITSTLAAPVVFRDEIDTILYFTAPGAAAFRDRHLQLLTALAGMVAVAWENAAMFKWLRAENDLLLE